MSQKKYRDILLCGYGGAGKDSVRTILEQDYGYTGMAFADGVREQGLVDNEFLEEVQCTYRELLEREGGYEQAKRKHPCVRKYLVRIGHGYREKYGEDHWIKQVKKKMQKLPAEMPVCVSDCRYNNERLHGEARVWYIERPGVGPANETEGESVPKVKHEWVIKNDGTLEDLKTRVKEAMEKTGMY